MSRFILMLVLAAGLMLGGCAPEDTQTEGAGGKQICGILDSDFGEQPF